VLLGESALALAGLGVGVAFAFARSNETDRATNAQRKIGELAMGDRAACSTPSSPAAGACRDFTDALDARRRDGTIETVGFVTAGVSATALLASWLLWPEHREPARALRYQPWLAKGALGLRGSF
jgi:hypothetical protein